MYRLLALDIDGTLVNSRDELTPATSLAAIRRALDAGISVALSLLAGDIAVRSPWSII